MTAYAADPHKDGEFEVSITPNTEDNTLEIEIKITLEPNEKGLFGISELKDHRVSVTLNSILGLKAQTNIQGITNWDISGTVTSGFTWKVDITHVLKRKEWESGLEDLFSNKNEYASYDDYYIQKQYENNIKKITDKLNQIAADTAGGEIKIFDWRLPIPSVPGLYFNAEVNLFAEFEMAANINIGQESTTVYTVGVCFINGGFKPYSNTYRRDENISLSLRGKASAKAGIKLIIKATLINDKVANINVDPQIGLYADIYVTIPILDTGQADDNRFIYSYFEPGVYFSANVNAYLNILIRQFEFSYKLGEKKYPMEDWTLGNAKIATGIEVNGTSVHAVNHIAKLPDILFEYYDVKSGINGTEKILPDDLKLVTNEGVQLRAKEGNLYLPEAASSGSCYVTATYLHTDGKAYSAVFQVLISGSMLEGKVSAYTDHLSMGTLEGALVELYTEANKAAPISTQTTDETGQFAFNVEEGSYQLVISADGYRTLTSNQKVKAEEIKYTEHILLMDNSQLA